MSLGLFVTNNAIDLTIEPQGLKLDPTLETSVLISLFTDKRASTDELPPGVTDKRGWWGDEIAEIEGDQIGSKLWLLERDKVIDTTLVRAEDFARDALQWMLDDGIAQSIEVVASFVGVNISLAIEIQRSNGVSEKFSVRWNEQEILRG